VRRPLAVEMRARPVSEGRETGPVPIPASDRGGAVVSILISAAELLATDRSRTALLDVRWALGDDQGRQKYLAGHLPGAVFVDLGTELADPPSATEGRHPMPSVQRLQEVARGWGIGAGDRVVAYDATGGLAAARAWWLLRWGGLTDVRLLDGGLDAWRRAGGPVESGEVIPEPGDVVLSGGHLPVLSIDEAASLPSSGVLLDARAGERYRGEVEPVDPRAGHVPGAVSAPTTENLAADGTFRPATELRARFADLGVQPGATVGVYCGSGVTAAHEVAALAAVGIDAALWPGSWSQWSADPDRPAASGD
jgi:3-mercaptopyruvate sulfurtransferase SseA